MEIASFFLIFVVSALITFFFTPWVGKLARIFDVIRYPPSKTMQQTQDLKLKSTAALEARLIAARRRLEKPPVAEWGGVSYITTFLVVSVIVLLVSKTINIPSEELNSYLIWFIAILVLFVGGIIDDKFELSGKTQLFFQILAAILFILTPLDLDIITNPFTGLPFIVRISEFVFNIGSVTLSISLPGDLFLLGWLLVMINAIKWQGGTDALMEGNVFIASLLMFVVSILFSQPASALFTIVLAGSLLGFLFYNFYPAKIMSGSSGKAPLGFIVASLAIVSNAKFAISLIVFAIPLVDMFWVLFRRMIDYKPKSLVELMSISDKTHLHHKLLKLGLTEPRVAFVEYSITAIMGVIALLVTGMTKALFVLVVWVTIFIFILFVTRRSHGQDTAKRGY